MISFNNITLLLQGAWLTLAIWTGAALCSIVLGSIIGLLRCKIVRAPIIAPMLDMGTLVLRAVPFYVQLLLAYFVIPELLGLTTVNALAIATIALGICSAAYVSQMVVSGVNGICDSQWETARTLGYTNQQTMWYVILPQLWYISLPAWCSEADQLMKSTALLSSIGIMELTGMARNIVSRELNPLPVYLSVALIYLCCSLLTTALMYWLKRKVDYVTR